MDAVSSPAWMLPSSQNAGLSAAAPVAVLVAVDQPDVAPLVALADALEREELRAGAAAKPFRMRGELGVAVETVEAQLQDHPGVLAS